MILTPKITLASPMSFISNLDPRNNLALETISKHVPNINMSSTYKHITTHSLFSDLEYTHLSTSLGEKPSQNKTLSNFSCHYFGACFNPYKDFKSLHI